MKNILSHIKVALLTLIFVSSILVVNSSGGANDGDPQVVQVSTTIIEYLVNGDFVKANKALGKILTEKDLTIHGKRQLEEVYNELQQFDNIEILDHWCKTTGQSHFPFSVRGNYYLSRISPAAMLFPDEIYKNIEFEVLLKNAENDFLRSNAISKDDPSSSTGMLQVSILLQYASGVIQHWYDKAIKTDAFWVKPHVVMLSHLSPQNTGSLEDSSRFAEDVFVAAPIGSAVYSIYFSYFDLLFTFHEQLFREDKKSTPPYPLSDQSNVRIKETINRYRQEFPYSSLADVYEGKYSRFFSLPGSAEAIFSEVISKQADNFAALTGRAQVAMLSGNLSLAKQDLEKMMVLEPDSSFVYANLGAIAFLADNDSDKGITFYEQAIEKSFSSLQKSYYRYDLAYLLKEYGDCQGAVELLGLVIESGNQQVLEEAVFNRGECNYDTGNLPAAIRDMAAIAQSGGELQRLAELRLARYKIAFKRAGGDVESISQKTSSEMVSKSEPGDSGFLGELEDTPIAQCRKYYVDSMAGEAAECFEQLLASGEGDDNEGEIQYMRGLVAEKLQKNYPNAAFFYAKAEEQEPGNITYLMAQAEILYRIQFYEKVIEIVEKVINVDGQNGRAFYLRALSLVALNDTDLAVADMKMARQLDPELQLETQLFLQKYGKGKIVKRTAPDLAKLLARAEGNMQRGHYNRAEKQFLEILGYRPNDDYATYRLGVLYQERDEDFQRALKHFSKAIELNDTRSEYFLTRASVFASMGQCENGVKDWGIYLQFSPTSATAYSKRGQCYEQLGNKIQARDDYQKAMDLEPDNQVYAGQLEALGTALGSEQLDVQSSEEGTEIKDDSGGETLLASAQKRIEENDLSGAEKDLHELIKLDPQDSTPFYYLGKLHSEEKNNHALAIVFYDRAALLAPEDYKIFESRGLALYNQNHFEEAILSFDQAMALVGEEASLLYMRGNCYRQLKDYGKAAVDYLRAKELDPSLDELVEKHLEEIQ